MLQQDRNWLFGEAYRLDNLTRIWLPKGVIAEVPVRTLERLRIQEKTKGIGVLFTEAQLEQLAENLRKLAADDEDRILNGCKARYR